VTHVLLVTGSRAWTDYNRLAAILRIERDTYSDLVVRHGKARRGIDLMAAQWCEENRVPQDPIPADWEKCGLAAGFLRNTILVQKEPRPYRCHAFLTLHSPGTRDCAKKARHAGIDVKRQKEGF
jgi:hypothetical protein